MPNPLLNLGSAINDHTGTPLRTAGQLLNRLPNPDSTINAGSGDYTGTPEAKITAAIAAAVVAGAKYVWVPQSLLPYNASLVTFNTGVRMIAEGKRSDVYHVEAYGAYTDGTTDSTSAIQKADDAAESNNGTVWFSGTTYRVSGVLGSIQGVGGVCLKVQGPVRWFGEPGATLQLANGLTTAAIVFINPVGSVLLGSQSTPIVLEGLTFDGNGLKGGMGVESWYTSNVIVQCCRFTRFANNAGISTSYACRFDGNVAGPANPYVWVATTPTGFGRNNQVLNCTFDTFTASGSNTANPIFFTQQDGGLVQGNTMLNTGWFGAYGVCRGIRFLGNTHEDGYDNGLRIQADGVGDNQRCRDHVLSGNRIRNALIDGIRLNGAFLNCIGNTVSWNNNSGIRSDACNDVIIADNYCIGNVNCGIFLSKASIAGQGGFDHVTIANNHTMDDANKGIFVQGGGDTGAIPATNIRVLGNRCFRCAVQGIQVDDADSRCQIIGNSSGEHGVAGGSGYGILVQAVNLSWGGATVSFNRSVGLVTGNAATAKQPFGIGFIAYTGKTLSMCYCYFNDMSDHPNTSLFFGTPVSTTSNAQGGTVAGQYLVGTLYRNCNRKVDPTAIGQANALQAGDIIVQVDESGLFAPSVGAATAGSFVALTEAVLVSGLNAAIGNYMKTTLTAARVVGAPLNPTKGQRITNTFLQDGTGSWAVTWNAVFKNSWSDTGNTLNKRSTISHIYDGTNWNQDGAQTAYV